MNEAAVQQQKVERIRRLLRYPNARIRALLSLLHPTEIARLLEDSGQDVQMRILNELPKEVLSEAIAEMDWQTHPGKLLTLLHPEVASRLIGELEWDDAADLLAQITEEQKKRILAHVPAEETRVINQLMRYEEDSAGGLMNPDVVCVPETLTKLEALREVVRLSEEIEEFYTIYVVDAARRLVGYLTFRSLFLAKNNQLVSEIMGRDVVSVKVSMDQEAVAKMMSQYNLPTLPVVDREGRLLGRVTFDDVLDVIEEETTEDILSFAGVSEDENLRGGWADAVRSRIPWLLVNLLTASVSAVTIAFFDTTIEKIVLLTSLMPVIAGVAGNGATQTLAVTIRRIATEGIPRRKAARVIFKELSVGAINGLMLGAIVSLVLMFVNPSKDPQFVAMMGLVVFVAMWGNLMLAGLAGSIIPLALERARVDPAVASSILITALTDVIGFLVLLGLASRLLLPMVGTVGELGRQFLNPVF
ncbi:MAG: magnesium transporter [Bacteroidetes bacterium]|nr:MAG: magnesium transporter [Bacteroidota bacterium]